MLVRKYSVIAQSTERNGQTCSLLMLLLLFQLTILELQCHYALIERFLQELMLAQGEIRHHVRQALPTCHRGAVLYAGPLEVLSCERLY